jgi:hypothetical protein
MRRVIVFVSEGGLTTEAYRKSWAKMPAMLSHRVMLLLLTAGGDASITIESSRVVEAIPGKVVAPGETADSAFTRVLVRFNRTQKPSITVKLHMAHPTVPTTEDDVTRNAGAIVSGAE